MASRIIHLSIANVVAKKVKIKDCERFFIGQMLPDVVDRNNVHHDEIYVKTHFKKYNLGVKYYDFSDFYKLYKEKILEDDLYLGYYLHIIEDAVFRKYIYIDLNLLVKKKDLNFTDTLYNDYRIIGNFLIKKYNLKYRFEDFLDNGINNIYKFDLDIFKKEFKEDFIKEGNGKCVYIDINDIEKFIELVSNMCINEISSIRKNGKSTLNALDYSY